MTRDALKSIRVHHGGYADINVLKALPGNNNIQSYERKRIELGKLSVSREISSFEFTSDDWAGEIMKDTIGIMMIHLGYLENSELDMWLNREVFSKHKCVNAINLTNISKKVKKHIEKCSQDYFKGTSIKIIVPTELHDDMLVMLHKNYDNKKSLQGYEAGNDFRLEGIEILHSDQIKDVYILGNSNSLLVSKEPNVEKEPSPETNSERISVSEEIGFDINDVTKVNIGIKEMAKYKWHFIKKFIEKVRKVMANE